MSMKDTFLCPGLVVRLPCGTGYEYILIEYVWASGTADVTNLKNNHQYMLSVWTIRESGVLVGQNFKNKI